MAAAAAEEARAECLGELQKEDFQAEGRKEAFAGPGVLEGGEGSNRRQSAQFLRPPEQLPAAQMGLCAC